MSYSKMLKADLIKLVESQEDKNQNLSNQLKVEKSVNEQLTDKLEALQAEYEACEKSLKRSRVCSWITFGLALILFILQII